MRISLLKEVGFILILQCYLLKLILMLLLLLDATLFIPLFVSLSERDTSPRE
jgi:hypothetical protein